eukprot:7057530-Prymnesium_polylepis.1
MRKAKRRVSGGSHTPSQPPALGLPVSVATVRPAPVARGGRVRARSRARSLCDLGDRGGARAAARARCVSNSYRRGLVA